MSDSAAGTDGAPRRLLLLTLSVTAVGQLSFVAVPPVLPELADALGVSRSAIGLVHGMVAFAGIFVAAYMGYLLDRFGRRRVVRWSLLLFGSAGAACFFAPNYWGMLGLRLLQGVGASTLLSVGIVLIGDQFEGPRRRWAMGLNVTAVTITGTLGPIAAGALGEGGAFRPFLLYLIAFPLWVAAGRLPEPAGALVPEPPRQHLREALGDLRRRHRLWDFLGLLPLSMVSLLVYYGLSQALTPLFLEQEFGLGTTERGLVLAAGAAASAVASALAGRLGERLRPAAVIGISLPLSVVGFVTVGLAPSLWIVALGVILIGGGYGSLVPVMMGFATSAGQPRYRGVLVGTYVTGNRVGMFAGPALATAVAGGLGDRRAYLAGAALVALVAAAWPPLRRVAARRGG
ncbi:MAG: MFS transporter [Acidimicrobiia bacterium]|nr:MFS transporter [Acidimicrobiia bacterium]